jgi:hypothetical protein
MKKMILVMLCSATLSIIGTGCDERPTSDDIQRDTQEKLLQEGTAQTGMPAIKNFQERKLLKMVLELRDQANLVTYTYLENMNPTIVHGYTARGGKLTYIGQTIGYGIPYATEYTNPQKVEYHSAGGYVTLPQADPNGLFSPASAEGTWILMKDPNSSKVEPVYIEPRIFTSPFPLPMD